MTILTIAAAGWTTSSWCGWRVDRRSRPTTDCPPDSRKTCRFLSSHHKKGCQRHCGGRRRETGVAAPDPFSNNLSWPGPLRTLHLGWVWARGSSRPLGQEESTWRCGVRIRRGGRHPLWGVTV